MVLRTRTLALVSATLLVTILGCSYIGPEFAPPCFPPAYTVDPSIAEAGEKVTVSAPAADCNPRYGEDAQIQIVVQKVRGQPFVEALAPMNDDGRFSYEFTVPANAPAGEAGVSAYPHNLDWCDDTGRNNRVGALERASCAERIEPLTIREAAVP